MAAPRGNITSPTLKVLRKAGRHGREALTALRDFEKEYPTFQVDARIALERCCMLVRWIESAQAELEAEERLRRYHAELEKEYAAHLVGKNPPTFGRSNVSGGNEQEDIACD